MADTATKPVGDSISKFNDEIAIGDNLSFQRKWWRFERICWVLFGLVILLDLVGGFGRGYLAAAKVGDANGPMNIEYDRVERFRTPSIMSVHLRGKAIHDGKARVWISKDLVKPLGNQRIIPQPSSSELTRDGVLYTFPARADPVTIEFALEPGTPGLFPLTVRVPDLEELRMKILVVP